MSYMSPVTPEAPPAQGRRLRRAVRVLRHGLPTAGRYRRYLWLVGPVLAAIWGLTFAYLALVPRTYTSEFSLILPGSGAGSSINVESIGQAQASTTSAFSSPTLSPTEGYKQLLSADITLRDAARIAHVKPAKFPAPTIKLIDQTNLINVRITGRTPEGAQRNAEGLRQAFLARLDTLRADEASKREVNDVRHLDELAHKVQDAQHALIDFQASHGLATLEQFNARIAAVDQLRDKERDLRIQFHQQAGAAGRLAAILGGGPEAANTLMRLRGDPVFQELVQRYAAANADAEQKAATLGARHATMAAAEAERGQLRSALLQRGHAISGLTDETLMRAADLQLSDGRNALMQAMSGGAAQASGTHEALAEVRGDLAVAQKQAPQWISLASRLSDLQRNQRVTDAVFSSALARLDTNRQDPFASYPLVQTLAAPSLPIKPTSPSLPIALAGAIAATLIALITFALVWLRQPILDRLARAKVFAAANFPPIPAAVPAAGPAPDSAEGRL